MLSKGPLNTGDLPERGVPEGLHKTGDKLPITSAKQTKQRSAYLTEVGCFIDEIQACLMMGWVTTLGLPLSPRKVMHINQRPLRLLKNLSKRSRIVMINVGTENGSE